jgi:hypothetical protein
VEHLGPRDAVTLTSSPPRGVSRRSLVKGSAWSVPTVVVATQAPALAASCAGPGGCPVVSRLTRVVRGNYLGCARLTWDSRPSTLSSLGVKFSVTTPATTITNVVVTFWISTPSLTFTVDNTVANWSTPTYSGTIQVVGSATYYAYSTTFLGTVTPVAGTTVIPFFFYSQCNPPSPISQFIQTKALVNGEQQDITGGTTSI